MKAFEQKKKKLQVQVYCEMLQSLCLGFVHIPKTGHIPFHISDKKLVQYCDTHTETQSCKAIFSHLSNTLSLHNV